MTTFKVFSDNCPRCTSAAETLRTAIAERKCSCTVQEVSCDSACDTAQKHGFAGKERPVVMRDNDVVHQGSLSKEQATALLPA
ncbi:hypothetical protein COU76_06005 [Candidatus Peregrinibacteria bacterium CG10_big_fil_rev_8_21_14_0_10_49_10]|nr:MAG: hypothetical protein COU76_06005 [Candidatus Peregrinibacteria bacterium CG10_big_fil_rev_8_21_14_0_10_49_10]